MENELNFDALKKKQRELRDEKFPDSMGLRVHRAISWIGCAEKCDEDAYDERFIFLWIAFNAAYADEEKNQSQAEGKGRAHEEYKAYFEKLVSLDKEPRIGNALRQKIQGSVKEIIKIRYTYAPFWKHYNGVPGHENWKELFRKAKRDLQTITFKENVEKPLSFVFSRLYVLRCQILHGGATWRGSVNRKQVEHGVAILEVLIPIFIDIMMDNPDEDWGKPFYPVVRT